MQYRSVSEETLPWILAAILTLAPVSALAGPGEHGEAGEHGQRAAESGHGEHGAEPERAEHGTEGEHAEDEQHATGAEHAEGGAAAEHGHGKKGERTSRISDDAIPLIDLEKFPKRPKPILELGNRFLGTGTLRPGFRLPSGAIWQPALIAFGTYRTAVQAFHDGGDTRSEWANRLDLFANLQLSGTERVLFGLRPLDDDGRFSGVNFEGAPTGGQSEFNAEVATFFFEGDFGEIFPKLDRKDFKSFDLGFAVGRQPLFFQEGMLINDSIDAIGVIRNTLLPRGGTDYQFTFVYGVNDVHRDDNLEDEDAQLFGVFVQGDFPVNTWNTDIVYVFDTINDTDGLYWGLSSVQRLGHTNTSFRVVGSHSLENETGAVSDGYLFFGEVSWTPPWTHNLVYVNTFWGLDNFSSAARGPATGGPLGRAGILFAAVGIGRYGAALGNRADDSAGTAAGYQMFFNHTRTQVIVELGVVKRTKFDGDELAAGTRFQQALGQHIVLQVDAFASVQESRGPGWGARFETRFAF